MNKLIFLFAFTLITMNGISQGWRPFEMEVKVNISNPEDFEALKQVSGNLEPALKDGSVFRAYLVPEELEQLKRSGLPFEISIANLNLHYEHFWDNPLVPPGYYSYEQIIAIADSLATNFPLICKKISWGTSGNGRQLAVLKISDNVNTDEPEPEIMFDGGIHGDEVGGSQNIIMFARDLCLDYASDPTISDLVNSREIWLFLMVNPDGRATMSRYNKNGVDCNRDNGYMWDGEGFSPSAFSQVETKALRNGILDNQFVVYTNYHSGIEIISYPWSYRSSEPRDLPGINQLAAVYSSSSGYAGGLQYGQGYNIMYAINGSTKDFQYGSLGNIGWSIEISADKQPPSSQIQYFYDVNKPAMLEVINQCGWGVTGTITDSLSGNPVSATIWIDNLFPFYNDPVVGDYHKFVQPGNYNLKITANGYKTKTISNITVPAQGAALTDFQLVPDTGWHAFKVMTCRIPGNNYGDEGYTPGCIGKPDNIPYSIGRNGWVTVDMGDTLYDGPGMDVKVFQSGTQAKNFTVSGSRFLDGPFTQIGTGSGTTSFDLGPSLLGKIRYLYIKDNGTGSATGVGAGFNLDAVSMITPPLHVSFSASNQTPCSSEPVNFTDQSGGNPVSWNWSFPGGNPSFSNAQNPAGITYQNPGTYSVTLTISNGVSSLGTTKTNLITVSQSPIVNLGNDTLVCDHDNIQLSAGNPGNSYLWSTGETTESIVVDSTGVGYGTEAYWVNVTAQSGCVAHDTIRITYDICTGIAQSEDIGSVSVYPNPASQNTLITIRGFSGGNWQLVSMDGTVLFREQVTSDHFRKQLDLSLIPGGIAVLKVVRNKSMVIKKIAISHFGE